MYPKVSPVQKPNKDKFSELDVTTLSLLSPYFTTDDEHKLFDFSIILSHQQKNKIDQFIVDFECALICESHFILMFRTNCGKGNTDTVEETEMKECPPTQESPETENTSLAPEGRTEAQNTEKGFYTIQNCLCQVFLLFDQQRNHCRQIHVHVVDVFYTQFCVFSAVVRQLCQVQVLHISPGVVVHHAAETLLLHWHAQLHAEPAG